MLSQPCSPTASMKHIMAVGVISGFMALATSFAPPACASVSITAAPGIPIFSRSPAGQARCTLGFTASTTSNAHLAVTAGHCGQKNSIVITAAGRVLGRYIQVRPDESPEHDGYALIALNDNVDMSASITPNITLKTQARAFPGDTVCLFGSTSGGRCGTVQDIYAGFGNIAGCLSAPGDSGGPVVRMSDQALVGIVLGHNISAQTTLFEHVDRIEQLAATDISPDLGLGPVIAR